MTTRRGLTLLEVLIATAMLAAMAVACLPLMQSAAAVFNEPTGEVDLDAFTELVDQVIAEPAAFGLTLATFESPTEFAWPADHTQPAVVVHRIARAGPVETEDESSALDRGFWLVFTCGPWQLYRWHPPEPPEQIAEKTPEQPPEHPERPEETPDPSARASGNTLEREGMQEGVRS